MEKDEIINELQIQLSQSKSKLQSAQKAESLVGQMFEAGIIVEDGEGQVSMAQR